MVELLRKINEIPDIYDDFILGVMDYAKEKPEHVETLLEYMNSNHNLSTSDIVYFIMKQPDFLETETLQQPKIAHAN